VKSPKKRNEVGRQDKTRQRIFHTIDHNQRIGKHKTKQIEKFGVERNENLNNYFLIDNELEGNCGEVEKNVNEKESMQEIGKAEYNGSRSLKSGTSKQYNDSRKGLHRAVEKNITGKRRLTRSEHNLTK
jgi:hypothetical protein